MNKHFIFVKRNVCFAYDGLYVTQNCINSFIMLCEVQIYHTNHAMRNVQLHALCSIIIQTYILITV